MHTAGWSTFYRTLNRSCSKGLGARRATQGHHGLPIVRAVATLSEGYGGSENSVSPHPLGTRTAERSAERVPPRRVNGKQRLEQRAQQPKFDVCASKNPL